MMRTANYATFRELATDIAREMNSLDARKWIVVPRDPENDMNRSHIEMGGTVDIMVADDKLCLYGKMKIFMRANSHRNTGKISVHGEFLRDKNNNVYPRTSDRGEYTSINVSIERGPKSIAKDIVRRFLPAYILAFGKGQQQLAERISYDNHVHSIASEFAAIMNVTINESQRDKSRFHYYNNTTREDVGYGDVEVYSDTATLHMRSLSHDKARKILAILMEKD